MRNQIAIVGIGLCFVGCGEPKPEPESPKPVTVIAPAEDATSTAPAAAEAKTGWHGKWTHTLPPSAGKEGQQAVVLEYLRDQDGRERFEFQQHPWETKPVFVEQKKSDETSSELLFKFVQPGQEADENARTLRYILKEDNGRWAGNLIDSANETAYDVVLTRSE